MLLTYVVVDERERKAPPSVVGNISRVGAAEAVLDLMDFIAQVSPDSMHLDDDIGHFYRGNIAASIAAGTYEIQLNLIAQQALNLPRGG
jgi:alkylation response protein AidB-like acyl-CoA dehydrogenase